jgi:hypothetical protein
MKELLFRLGREDDQHAIQKLMELVFESGRLTSPEFFDWQYRQNPYGPATLGCCEAPDGNIVACLPTIPVPIRIRGQQGLAGLILNVATHPNYRRKGLFVGCAKVAFEELARRGYVCLFGFPNEMIYWGYIRKLGFRDLGQPQICRHFFEVDTVLSQLGNWAKWLPAEPIGRFCLRFLQRTPKRVIEVRELSTFDGLPIERLWESAAVGIAADQSWLNWRYIRHPLLHYRIAMAGEVEAPIGVAVYKVDESHLSKRGILMELFLAEDHYAQAAESLAAHLLEDFQISGCTDAFALVTPKSRKAKVLRSCGYWVLPDRFGSSPNMIFRTLQEDLGDIDLGSVDFTPGMLDTA